MPTTINQDVLAAQDGYANANGVYNIANSNNYVGHLSTTNYDNRAFWRFPIASAIPFQGSIAGVTDQPD
jgi:hypothetical protein